MRRTRLTTLLLVLLMITSFLFGCANNTGQNPQQDGGPIAGEDLVDVGEDVTYPINITDGLGNSITIDKEPERLVSIDPSQTEILFALGLDEKIVGVSNFCDYPVEALEKEKVGDAFAVNVEKIIELDPDIVFIYGAGQPDAVEQMKANDITIISNESETIDEIFNSILQTGKIANVEEKADQLVKDMKEEKNNIINRVKDADKVRVFYEVWDQPLMTAGQGSFIDELITLAGGENVAADGQGAYPEYSVENMLEKDPEVYIVPDHAVDDGDLTGGEVGDLKEAIKARPGYHVISAVKNNRIELLEPNIVSRPGIRIIEALELFARAIHPEAF